MSSTPPASRPTSPTFRPRPYVYPLLPKRGLWLISYPQKISGYLPKDDGLKKAFTGADIVVIPAGIPRERHLHN